ncbi:hypothetical protein M0802_013872 [Mischocyttarus mexicanus]|nr:hypothetical protein M0802_013872 [Mischocyttarus mexicanus]
MAKPSYKLSSVLFGHASDVRAIATFADGSIVSTSRDKTARVWKPSGNGKDYIETAVLKGHTNFVSSVCVINPSDENPKGLIITGSNDNTICVYEQDQIEPFFSHTIINLSADPVTMLPSTKSATHHTAAVWPVKVTKGFVKSLVLHNLAVISQEHERKVFCSLPVLKLDTVF